MSTPPLPAGLPRTRRHRVANVLHSIAIHVLREARAADLETGLSPQRLSALSVLVFAGPKSVSDLAAIEQVSSPAISNLLTALERNGYVRRERVPGDARSVMVHATSAGLALMEQGRRRRLEIVAQRLTPLSSDNLKLVERALRLLEQPDSGQRRS